MHPQPRKHALLSASALAACLVAGTIAFAQEKKEEEPFWAKGRPKGDVTAKMAPVAAPPVPTPEAQLPKLTAPPGFKVEVYQSGILDARGLRRGDKGTVFVSSLFVAGKIYAVTGDKGKRTTKTIAEKLELPNGIEFNKGSLYVATPKQITRYDKIEDNLDKPPEPVKVFDQLPGDIPHGWKFIKFGPDGKLYVPVGAPCNICESRPREVHADLPHQRGRHRARRSWRAACATRWASTSTRAPRSCGSPTTSATGWPRTSRSTSSTASPTPARTTSAIPTAIPAR